MNARWSIALLVLSCARLELPDEPVLREYSVPQRDFQLDSGLRVLVQEDHSTPLVVVTAVYGVGGVADPTGREGVAHFVEHLAFRSRPGGQHQLWDVLKRTGAAFNASTAADLTMYFEIAHKDRLPDLLQIEAWRLTHTLDGVTEDVFEVEREVVRNELRQRRETTVGNRLFDELLVQLFPPQHPLGGPLAGTHESLSAATLADAKKFVAEHYSASNCTIVVAGDVKAADVSKLLGKWPAEALYGPQGPGGAKVAHRKRLKEIAPSPPPPPPSTTLRRLKGPVERPLLVLGWSAPGGLRGNDMALSFTGAVLNFALATGIPRKEKDDLLGVSAGAAPLGDGSVILIQAELRAGADPEAARRRILDAVAQTWSNDLSRLLVKAGKWGAATQILRASADPVQSAIAVAQYLATTGQTAFYKQTLEGLAGLQPGAVTNFAYNYLKRDRAAAVFFEPETEAGAGGAGSAARGGRLRPGEHELGRSTDVNLTGMGADDIRRIAPPPGFAALPRFKLANGLEVVMVKRTAALMAEVYLQLPGGDATATPYGLASLATSQSSSRCQIHGGLSEVGGTLGGGGDDLASILSVHVMSGNLTNGLAVLADAVTCREADEEDFLDLSYSLKRPIERYQEHAKLPQARADKAFWATLYPGHPYGLRDADPATLTGIKYADASAFVRAHFRPDSATAVVVADAPQAELSATVQKYFGGWATGAAGHRTAPDAGPGPAARTIQIFDRPEATQSSIQIGCRVAKVTAETLPAFDLLEAVTTEKAWELRESWGATYGITATVQDFPGGVAHLVVEGNVETAKTGDALDKVLGLLATIGNDGPDFKTFVLKRWDLAREYSRNLATGGAVARALLRAKKNGWPADVWDRYPGLLADTTRAGVRDAAKPCVGHEVITVVGDAKTVRPQLAAHGLKL